MQSPPLPATLADLRFTVHEQGRGQSAWYAVKSPAQRFIRLGRKEYLIASALDGRRTAAEVVAAVLAIDAAILVSEEEVLKVVSWLVKVGLVDMPNAAPCGVGKSTQF